MISNFNFDFYKKNITTSWTIWAFQEVSHFSNKCSSTVYAKSALDLVGQIFLKMMLAGHVWMGEQKISGGETTMDDAMILWQERGTFYISFLKVCSHFSQN